MTPHIYHFGEFRLDTSARELRHDGQEVPLPLKAFECLVYLIENRSRAVGRDELFQVVWRNTHLTENALDQAIFVLRRTLDDATPNQQHIKTVRGFGYHWTAEVEVEADRNPTADETAPPHRLTRFWPIAAATVIIGALILAISTPWSGRGTGESAGILWHNGQGDIAVVLPVKVSDEEGLGWIRFGAMELIADRLRAAGQPAVPSETVIALLQRLTEQPDQEEVQWLVATTGARLLFEAQAERRNGNWRVSLRNQSPDSPQLSALGEAEDVFEAARIAADRMALSLGHTPAPEPDTKPGLTALVQQLQAAILAGQPDVALDLAEAAEAELRMHPEVRFQLARLDYYHGRLDTAESEFKSLLEEPSTRQDPVFHSRILTGLAGIHFVRNNYQVTDEMLQTAVKLLDRKRNQDRVCTIMSNMGGLAMTRGDFDTARTQLVQARIACDAAGDIDGVANVDSNLGILEGFRERYPEAIVHFEHAAERNATMHSIDAELRTRANIIIVLLEQLDFPGAAAVEQRLSQLIDQTRNPVTARSGQLVRAHFLAASGQISMAEDLLAELLVVAETETRLPALVLGAELAAQSGAFDRAADLAGEAVQITPQPSMSREITLAQAWLILIRANLALGNIGAATNDLLEMTNWTTTTSTSSAKSYSALAQAELAVAEGHVEIADTSFQQALSLADTSRAPRRLLDVAESYVSWLLTDGPGLPDPERALVVASYVANFADRSYEAALLQLRVTHAIGAPTAWRTALARTRSLAGERQIPEELLTAPRID